MTTPSRFTQTSLFSPTQISGCSLWLDAADSSTVTLSGSNVTQWNDKSGINNNAVVPSGGTSPIYQVNSLNTQATISFGASNDVLFVANNFAMSLFPSLCYFIVIRPASTQPNNNNAGILSTDTPTQFGRSLAFGLGNWQQEHYNSFTNITPYTANVWAFVSLQFNSTVSTTLAVNGTTFAGTPTGTKDNTNGLHIGTYNNSGSYAQFNANFNTAEILIYSGVLSTSQRQQIEGYLAWKWGLVANLPANHPYKNTPIYAAPPFPLVPQVKTFTSAQFNPTTINGCQLWLDAADSSTVVLSGTNVTQWNDKSGNNYSASNLGTITTTTQNGLNVLDFGLNQMTIPSYNWRTHSSFFVVAKSASANFLFSQRSGNAYTNYYFTGNFDLFFVGQLLGLKDSVNAQGVPVVSSGNYFIFTFAYAGGTAASFYTINGTSRATVFQAGSAVTNFVQTFNMFINGNSIFAFDNSQVCEILHYNGSLSLSQRQQIEGYLAWKWGLVGFLPANHPYKQTPPYSTAPFPLVPRVATMTNRLFNPRSITGCQLWLDAADSSIVTLSGSNITQLRDKSTNAYIFSNATGFTYNVTKFQGIYPSFYSDAYVSSRNLGSNTSISLTQPMTFFTVCVTNLNGAGYVFDSTTSGNRMAFISYLGARPVMFAGVELFAATGLFNSPTVWSGNFNSSSSLLFLNGTQNVSGNAGTQGATGIMLGARFNNVDSWSGHICEILMYSGVLLTLQRQQIEGYLAWKWGLQANLPASHPYKLFPPSP
jgi:hypothetical protein